MRLKVNDKNSLCRFSTKFGVDINHARSLLTCATNLKLKVVGVSFHVGSGCKDAVQYYEALQMCRQVFDLAATTQPLEIIDIGGGFPGLHDESSQTLLKNISIQLNKGFTDLFLSDYHIKDLDTPQNNPELPPIQVISEPGRFFVQSSHTLLVNVISKNVFESKTDADADTSNTTYYYYLNDGVYGSFNCIFFDHQKPEILPYNERDGEKHKSTVFGPTCDSIDKICEAIELPELEIGEWCFVKNFGAYTTAAASNFNGFSKTPAFYVLD
jgi:ornithine decarboxylase